MLYIFFYLISIPTGTIKRVMFTILSFSDITFQFLLVRLKEEKKEFRRLEVLHFNSYWYD